MVCIERYQPAQAEALTLGSLLLRSFLAPKTAVSKFSAIAAAVGSQVGSGGQSSAQPDRPLIRSPHIQVVTLRRTEADIFWHTRARKARSLEDTYELLRGFDAQHIPCWRDHPRWMAMRNRAHRSAQDDSREIRKSQCAVMTSCDSGTESTAVRMQAFNSGEVAE